ncbi:MAG: IS21-like element helper ATPase IstB [Phycisphaerae bacterium]|nr:IS21-like element helper ATPase IstB [Phycisphaerae bacterium]
MKSTILLEHHLKNLKLSTIRNEYKDVAKRCAKDNSDYETYLLRLIEREVDVRQQRAMERRIKDARFPSIKTIDSFDFKAQPKINEALVKELLNGEFISARENVLFIGNSGTGKTHMAIALGFAACTAGRKVRFYSVTNLVTQLLEKRQEQQLERLQKQLGKIDLLILDELGYVPFSKAGAELLFEVISRAYERNSLVITTNLPFNQWVEVMGNERLTGAMLDRLTHRVHIIEANGISYRLQEAKKRSKRRTSKKTIVIGHKPT